MTVTETVLYHIAPKYTDDDNNKRNSSSSWGWLLKLQETGQHGRFLPVNPNFDLYCNTYSTFPKVLNALDFRVSELSKFYTCIIDMQKYIVSYGDKYCLVQEDGRALTIDYSLKEKINIASPLSIQDDHDHSDHGKHLVVGLDGELLLVDVCLDGKLLLLNVLSYANNNNVKTNKWLKKLKHVKVFKLNAKEKKWVKMESLEGMILFVGFDYTSFSVFAGDFPGCKGICICLQYFHDQVAVFDLIAGCFLPLEDLDCYTKIFFPPWSRSEGGRDCNGQQLLMTDLFPRKEELLPDQFD
ncbi:hypothetical protein FEM48_Zijuj10G0027400 [Ziziphus jujuba var. spinosa]|uniref:KIB1-4 beta-propeller domain-containing protein n=1 Tax=Ziziphus jujuba var. spinosa TaxID=714518 RepID=A0A978UKU7_ZIZJJ|nr:hypothetical protein FEM48_Zijuj10G0027400 [Ziziphus jujuba var. spinosa]